MDDWDTQTTPPWLGGSPFGVDMTLPPAFRNKINDKMNSYM